jgi:iron complex transport system substrate-binding protein
LEKIVALQPTIVIMQQSSFKLSKRLNSLGIKTKIVKIDRLHNIKSSILTIGEIVHKSKEAQTIVENINKSLKDLEGIVSNKKILMVIGHNTSLVKQIFVVGQNLYLNDIIEISDNKNALQSNRKGQPVLNQENIIATNPDLVILLAHSMKEKGLSKKDLIEPWEKLPINAGKNSQIYIVDKEYSGIPSHRLILFLKDFKEILLEFANKQL